MTTTPPRPATSASSPSRRSSRASPTRAASDALPEEDDNVPADLGPETNPAVEESPDPLKKVLEEGEDTDTEATKSDDGTRRGRRAARGVARLTLGTAPP